MTKGQKQILGGLALLVIAATAIIYADEVKRKETPNNNQPRGKDEVACIQVITPARNPQTGEVRDFPTPCDVPEGWEVISQSDERLANGDLEGWQTYRNEECGFEIKYPPDWTVDPQYPNTILTERNPEKYLFGCLQVYRDIDTFNDLSRDDQTSLFIGLIQKTSIQEFVETETRRLAEARKQMAGKEEMGAYDVSDPKRVVFAGRAVLIQKIGGEGVSESVITVPDLGIRIMSSDAFNKDMRIILDQILSTFRFIE